MLIELHDTNQSISLLDENENTLVHSTAKFHIADCLSVRLHSRIYSYHIATYPAVSCINIHVLI